MMEHYTTQEQESKLEIEFNQAVELYKQTHKIKHLKWHPSTFVKMNDVVCHVKGSETYFVTKQGKELMLPTSSPGGKIYKLDESFRNDVEAFCQSYSDYTVAYNLDGKYGRTIVYFANGATPAVLTSSDGFRLLVEDENKYDFVCG
ncbi:Hypothetical protein POVR1_LOCUS490 [uncultured virus]|nr:Hypothetical protein POVR1_LOCUS490 [uncultured virus]